MSDKLIISVKTIVNRSWMKMSIAAAVVLVLLIAIAFNLFHSGETKPAPQDHVSSLLRSLKKSTKLDVHNEWKVGVNIIAEDIAITDVKKIKALYELINGLKYIQVYYPGTPDFADAIWVTVYENQTVLCRFVMYGDTLEIDSEFNQYELSDGDALDRVRQALGVTH